MPSLTPAIRNVLFQMSIPCTLHKAWMVSEGIAPFILNFSSGLGRWSASRHGHLTPSEKESRVYEPG
jgi:hypothetical protein